MEQPYTVEQREAFAPYDGAERRVGQVTPIPTEDNVDRRVCCAAAYDGPERRVKLGGPMPGGLDRRMPHAAVAYTGPERRVKQVLPIPTAGNMDRRVAVVKSVINYSGPDRRSHSVPVQFDRRFAADMSLAEKKHRGMFSARSIQTKGMPVQRIMLSSDELVNLAPGHDGQHITLLVQQDAKGGHKFAGQNISGLEEADLSGDGNHTTAIQMVYEALNNNWQVLNVRASKPKAFVYNGPERRVRQVEPIPTAGNVDRRKTVAEKAA